MKLTISTYSLSRWRREQSKTLEQALDWIAGEAGLKAVEFSGLDGGGPNTPARAAKIRRRCEKLGLKIVNYCVPGELLRKPAEQRKAIEAIRNEIDVAAELGAPGMRHDVSRGFPENWSGPKTFAAALKVVVPAVRALADYGQSRGVRTSIENHGFFLQDPARVEKLLQAVDHPNYGLTMDMGNFLCVNADPVDAVRRLAKYAVMVHAKDFHVRPKKAMPPSGWFATPTPIALRGAIVGHGVIDIPRQFKLLKSAGYDGYVSLEFEGMEEPLQAVKLGLAYLRAQMTAVAR